MGLGQGSGVLVGQNLGAGQPGRAEKSGWLATAIASGFALVVSLIIMIWAEYLIRVFNTDPEVVKITSEFLRIAAAGYIAMGFYFVLQNSISGAGDTLPPMLVTLLNFWMVQITLAFILSRYTDLGMYGVRWAMVTGMIVGAIAYATYFKLGRWKRKRV
jgi:Na+-driven multidrug efflux pump